MIEWHERSPVLFSLISEINNEDNNKAGINYSQFLNAFTIDLVDNPTQEHISSIFHLIDDDNSGTLKLTDLQKIAKEVGETISYEELKEMFQKVAGENDEIKFEDFNKLLIQKQIL